MKPFCVYCGIDLSRYPNSSTCPNCSGSVTFSTQEPSSSPPSADPLSQTKFCHQCGTALLLGAKFCQSCGVPVKSEAVSSDSTLRNKTVPPPPRKRASKRKESKTTGGSPAFWILGTVGIGLAGLIFLNSNMFNPGNPATDPAASSPPVISKEIADRMKQLQEELNRDPNNYSALVALGNLVYDSHNFSEAIQFYQRALKIHPEDANVRVDMGAAYSYLNNLPLAIQETRRALEGSPRHLNAHFNLGIMYANAGDPIQAREYYQKVITLAPGSPIAKTAEENIKRLEGMPMLPAANDGGSLYDLYCTKCHERIDPKKYKPEEWPAFVSKYGTPIHLSQEQQQKIIDYLQHPNNP